MSKLKEEYKAAFNKAILGYSDYNGSLEKILQHCANYATSLLESEDLEDWFEESDAEKADKMALDFIPPDLDFLEKLLASRDPTTLTAAIDALGILGQQPSTSGPTWWISSGRRIPSICAILCVMLLVECSLITSSLLLCDQH